ncbi:hypothetical protein ADL26_15525, partial [Thermoactinomyces vulgaris]
AVPYRLIHGVGFDATHLVRADAVVAVEQVEGRSVRVAGLIRRDLIQREHGRAAPEPPEVAVNGGLAV